jgi:hypothetical protein
MNTYLVTINYHWSDVYIVVNAENAKLARKEAIEAARERYGWPSNVFTECEQLDTQTPGVTFSKYCEEG